MNSDIKTYLSLSFFLIFLNGIVFFYNRGTLPIFTTFLSLMFIMCVYILDKIKNSIYYYITILLTSLLSLLYLIYFFDFVHGTEITTIVKVELVMLFILSIVMFTALSRSIAFLKNSNENEPKIGPKGAEGLRGYKGKTVWHDEQDYIYNNMVRQTNKLLHEYQSNIILDETDENTYIGDYLQNTFMKNKFKQIARSENAGAIDNESQLNHVVNNLNNKVKIWINHLLTYNQGFNFLTDKNQTEKDWNRLLSKKDNENPFILINQHEEWNW